MDSQEDIRLGIVETGKQKILKIHVYFNTDLYHMNLCAHEGLQP